MNMKVGVLSDGDDLSSEVSEDFGHAPYFLIVDYDTLDYEVVENEFMDAEGAGMKVANAIVGIGVDAVITGGIGSHGYDILTKAGIKVSFDEEGTVEECMNAFKRRVERDRKFA
ncbi:MAG: NifB/NifX family molybdenum-iron cluster-binding protein [Methanomassiliicoccales archaeon]|uniref:NifB/NifX family molybdenum-iron cluster-binding protein n=2 Tax=Candidatus Methanarcanum hacksteinii TaxID=2911857 RepID=UPI00270AB6A7|nr:NifB/NifX family molybdenum-iron cluster-binding protein [Methanomassiliicoccales archaeon]MDO5838386.1 NifB/NifX family molybdenum-iron cluster-binding protein [Methanomassiliicoccales archaeon]